MIRNIAGLNIYNVTYKDKYNSDKEFGKIVVAKSMEDVARHLAGGSLLSIKIELAETDCSMMIIEED